jgi:HAD superfamily hydrolase (TIGR01484 family)
LSAPPRPAGPLRPVAEWPRELARGLVCIFSDIDDTISSEGRIHAEAYAALWQAREAGLRVVPVTGRPAGWCDHIARMWPVDGVIGENGGLLFRLEGGRMVREFRYGDDERAGFRRRLEAVRREILASVPGCGIASDQAYREYDLAIDFCEDVPALPREQVLRIQRIFEAHGATAKISSIHVNGWYGQFDKRSAVEAYLRTQLGLDPADPDQRARCAFAGDSPNDEPLFGFFESTSVGVANLGDFLDLIRQPPAWITRGRGGAGFAEWIGRLVELRG